MATDRRLECLDLHITESFGESDNSVDFGDSDDLILSLLRTVGAGGQGGQWWVGGLVCSYVWVV